MTSFNLAYIPDPGKKPLHVGYAASDARARAQHKPVLPLMTIIAVADADKYLSQKHGREVVLNGEAAALPIYDHNNAQWYRRTDLDALVIAEKSVEVVEERKDAVVLLPLEETKVTSEQVEPVEARVSDEERYQNRTLQELPELHLTRTYKGPTFHEWDCEIQDALKRFTPGNKRIVERYFFHGEDLARIRTDAKQTLDIVSGILLRAYALFKEKGVPVYEKVEPPPVQSVYESPIEEPRTVAADLSLEEKPLAEPPRVPLSLESSLTEEDLSKDQSTTASSNDERSAKFLPPERTETPLSPAALLYHALTKYRVIRREVPDDVVKVEEALQYMTDLQKEILELYYVQRKVSWRIENKFKITAQVYRRERRAAEAIVCAVIDGTYQPCVIEEGLHETKEEKTKSERTKTKGVLEDRVKDAKAADPTFIAPINGTYHPLAQEGEEKPQAVRKRKYRVSEEEQEDYGEIIKRKPSTAKPAHDSRKKTDLQRRMEEYRALHGAKGTEIRTNEDERDLEKYIGNLGKEVAGVAEDAETESLDVSLEQRCQKKHKKVQAFLRQMRRLPNLSERQHIYDLTAIIIGDSTIDFLINSPAYPVAALYAELLYARAKTRAETGSKKSGTHRPSLWPLVTEVTYNPHLFETKEAADHSHDFLQSYEAYAAGEKTPEALVALYKENLALLRGYVAVVGWHIGSSRTFRPDWEYRQHWKIAWQELAGFLKEEKKAEREEESQEERKFPLLLRATRLRDLVKDPAIKAALHRGYAAMYHYSERARNIVVEQFTGLAKARAKKLFYLGMTLDDAVQEGTNGLLRATSRFDYTRLTKEGKPHSFMTYAQWWIDQGIKRAAQDERGAPVSVQEDLGKMSRIEAELTQELGTKPSEALLHEEFVARTGLSKAALKLIQKARLRMNPISLELNATEDPEGRTLLDTLKDTAVVAADETLADKQQAKKIGDLLETLPERQRNVLKERYWGDQGEGKTLCATGEEIDGLSRERIRQIERDALTALKEHIEKEREAKAAEAAKEENSEEVLERTASAGASLQDSFLPVELSCSLQTGGGSFRRQLFTLEQRLGEEAFTAAVARLSSREQEVVAVVYTRGMSRKQVGVHLGVGDRTVATHFENIRKKLAPYFVAAKNVEPTEPWSLLYAELSKGYPFLVERGGREFVTSVLDTFSPTDQEYMDLRYEKQMTFTKIAQVKRRVLSIVRSRFDRIHQQLHQKIMQAAEEKRGVKINS